MTTEQYAPYHIRPPSGTKSSKAQEFKTNLDDVQNIEAKKKRRFRFWLILLIALIAMVCIGIGLAIYMTLRRQESTNCVPPYASSPSGGCVNVLIDVNNCGTIGHNCSASNYTSCLAGTCSNAPGIQLANSNYVWTAGINGQVDDNFYGVTLPWNITLYNTSTSFVYVTTNGVICLGLCSSAYTETALPAAPFSGVTALPYWDDLFIYANTSQGIYYGTEGNAPNRTLIFECYMSHYNQASQYYHFQVVFFEAAPGIVQYKYFSASGGGISCTIGVQASSSGSFIQYSFDTANSVFSRMMLTFDTNYGTATNSTF
ncbi:unnamed protein product [Rotaria magnacalcarata]|uniref:Uncharacterized protein n=2 Tax=Rotaria magnacalcarata TaxID=392030 RepID=A0A816GW60_9BILA|nr:unnamed protein product [Rotaria magnacalcarata]CAF2242766.1 unnamed protein product [Rotaria magnacalcarata]